MGKQLILIHGTNGEGYSDTTIKRLSTLNEALKYIGSVFHGRRPDIDNDQQYAAKNGFSFFTTDGEGTTERIVVYAVEEDDIVLVAINANITQYDIHKFHTKDAAIEALNDFRKLITEPDEESITTRAAGEGADAYYHFEIV
jgi:hypothetical protein